MQNPELIYESGSARIEVECKEAITNFEMPYCGEIGLIVFDTLDKYAVIDNQRDSFGFLINDEPWDFGRPMFDPRQTSLSQLEFYRSFKFSAIQKNFEFWQKQHHIKKLTVYFSEIHFAAPGHIKYGYAKETQNK